MADVPSTLKPAETAVALIEMAVAKHNTRWDKTFFKAVCYRNLHLARIDPDVSGVGWRHAVVRRSV